MACALNFRLPDLHQRASKGTREKQGVNPTYADKLTLHYLPLTYYAWWILIFCLRYCDII